MFPIPVLILLLLALKSTNAQEPFSEAQKEILLKTFEKCSKQSNVDMTILQKARNNEFLDDTNLKNYYSCLFQALKFMDTDGVFDTKVVRAFLHMDGDKAKWDDIVEHCFEKPVNGDVPLVAYHAVVCFTHKVGGKINL